MVARLESALGEIRSFDQQGAVASRGRVHRGPQAGGAAADDDHIPGPGGIELCQQAIAGGRRNGAGRGHDRDGCEGGLTVISQRTPASRSMPPAMACGMGWSGEQAVDAAIAMGDFHHGLAFELAAVGGQPNFARLLDDGAGHADFAQVVVAQRTVGFDAGYADQSDIDLETADEIDGGIADDG